jgi:hypothetical protein
MGHWSAKKHSSHGNKHLNLSRDRRLADKITMVVKPSHKLSRIYKVLNERIKMFAFLFRVLTT